MRVVYIADDGKEFDDKYDCEDYEWKLYHPYLNDVRLYDGEGNELKNIFSQYTYETVMKIIVPSEIAAKDLRKLGCYTGWRSYEDISESGEWIWNDDMFVKVK